MNNKYHLALTTKMFIRLAGLNNINVGRFSELFTLGRLSLTLGEDAWFFLEPRQCPLLARLLSSKVSKVENKNPGAQREPPESNLAMGIRFDLDPA